jgi:hypothetical protein
VTQEALQEPLRLQLAKVNELRNLAFDDQRYQEWRIVTGHILERLFGFVAGESHPSTRAFLNYSIPTSYTASRDEMQEFYRNILRYQADLLKMYLEDLEEQ